MTVSSVIFGIVFLVFSGFILSGILMLEKDIDEFRDKYGVKPKNYRCVTKGDMYCTHSDWCEAEIALYPEQYEYEMKLKENDKSKDQ